MTKEIFIKNRIFNAIILILFCGFLFISCGGNEDEDIYKITENLGSNIENAVPNVVVLEIPEGNSFQLKNIIDETTPVLIWFWAPH